MKKLMIIMMTLMLFVLGACSKQEKKQEEFVIGVIPTMNEGTMKTGIDKLQKYLTKELSMNVKLDVYPDYQAVVEAMNYGKVDMAYYGPLTYVIANHENGAQAIVTQLIKGKPFYHSYLIVHKDSKYNSFEDVVANSKEISFAFGDPESTSGALIPGIALKDSGIFKNQNEHSFKNVVYTGGHDATAVAIENKQVDVGAIDSAIFTMLQEKGTIGKDFKVIWQSEDLFQYPWAVKKGTDKKLIIKLQNAFLKVTDKDILDAFGATGFTKANDEDYKAIREAAEKDGRLK